MRWFLLLLLAATVASVHARPVRCAFDAKVVDWNRRCITNNPFALTNGASCNQTLTLIALSQWMGAVRAAGLYPGTILRANLMCGNSYGGTNGAGDSLTVGSYNIGSPQIPIINDTGNTHDVLQDSALQGRWKYRETGSTGGLGGITNAPATNICFFNTGIKPINVPTWTNDVHYALYMMGRAGNTNYGLMGVFDTTNVAIITAFPTATFWSFTGQAAGADTNGGGFWLGTRTSAATNGIALYKNASVVANSSQTLGNPNINFDIWVFGYQASNFAPPQTPTDQLSGGYAIGRGITSTNSAIAYYNAWQRFETLLGRQK